MKWSITGDVPRNLKKYLIIVAPHTSNWDFILGLVVRRLKGFQSSFLAKSTLFNGAGGWLFRKLGGYPVDRTSSQNLVDQVVQLSFDNEQFVLAITPEGTRGNVAKWKTGFYHIAKKSGMPLVMAAMDYSKKDVRFYAPYFVSENAAHDTAYINQIFNGVKGKNREAAPFILN